MPLFIILNYTLLKTIKNRKLHKKLMNTKLPNHIKSQILLHKKEPTVGLNKKDFECSSKENWL